MRKKLLSLIKFSVFKFIALILIYFLLIFIIEQLEIEGKIILDSLNAIIDQTDIQDQVLYDRATLFIFWYNIIKTYALYLFGFGILLNIVAAIVVSKTKSKPAIIVLGIIKVLTLSIVSGFLSIIYGIVLDKNAKVENKVQSVSSNSKNYNHKVYRISTLFLFGAIICYCATIGAFIYMKIAEDSPIPPTGILFIGLLLFLQGTYLLLSFSNKRRCFIKSYKTTRTGMSVDEVKNIMRLYPITNSGYTRNNEYVLEYKIKRGRQYEIVKFIFFNNSLMDYSTGYRRIVTR